MRSLNRVLKRRVPVKLNRLSTALLKLNFLSNTLDPRITFTRATTATRINPSGLIETVAVNAPRFDYDPVTRAPKGLLIEEQRTDLMLHSEDYTNAAWLKVASSILADITTAPNGALTADKLVEDVAANQHRTNQVLATVSGTTYTFSVYAKAAERSRLRLRCVGANSFADAIINLGTNQVTSGTAIVSQAGNGWKRISITGVADSTSTTSFINVLDGSSTLSYTGDGASGLFIWGAQLEVGAFATSYIPTSTAAATRAADMATMTGANFSNWYVQNDGTFFSEFIPSALIAAPESRGVISVDSGFARGHYFHVGVGIGTRSRDASAVYSAYTGTVVPEAITKMAGVLAQDLRNISVNGSAIVSDTTVAAIPVNTQLLIGDQQIQGSVPRQLNGWVRQIAYFPRRLSNTELQAITT